MGLKARLVKANAPEWSVSSRSIPFRFGLG
jgi:hypothetical protein